MIRPPGAAGRWALTAGGVVWVVVAAARVVGRPMLLGAVLIGVVLTVLVRRSWALPAAALVVAASASGFLSVSRESAVLASAAPTGPVEVAGIALDDPRPGASGDWFLLLPTGIEASGDRVAWNGPPLLVSVRAPVDVAARDTVSVQGVAVDTPGTARGDPYAGVIRGARVTVTDAADDPLFRVGNAIRARIRAGLDGEDAAHALLSGFLIGDVRQLPPVEADRLRKAGLSHFVAVSGSNVALFLVLWWVVVGPFAFGPRRRAVVGLVGLAIFIVVTRWEPSVLRAAGMAGLLLTARAAGVALTPWTALGTSVAGLLLISGELAGDVGFQLSVAATAGVMIGAEMFTGRLPRRIGAPLGATVAAQLAVAPILLWHFGTIPLLSPLANLAASPLVMMSTAAGGIGVLAGFGTLTRVGVFAARCVLLIARVASGWPQLGPAAATLVIAGALLSMVRRFRPLVVALVAGVLIVAVAVPKHRVPAPAAVFLDVGQGDAELVVGSDGATMLIDGGPDPVVILRKLGDYGVDHVDVLVLSHPHDDHAAGLLGVVEQLPVGVLWHPGFAGGGPAALELVEAAKQRDVPVYVPSAGDRFRLGDLVVEIIGPLRRYASPNDQSLVLRVSAAGTVMLFAGDIEKIAQSEIGEVQADVLKVPHQGAATSDPDWLVSAGALQAVVSVGPNTFGHPSDQIVTAMETAGMQVRRTDREGDIVIPFAAPRPPADP